MWGLMQLLCLEFPRRVLQEYLVNSTPLSMYALLLDMVEMIGDDQECWGGATSRRNFGIVLEFTLPSHKYVSLIDPILGTSTAEITEWVSSEGFFAISSFSFSKISDSKGLYQS